MIPTKHFRLHRKVKVKNSRKIDDVKSNDDSLSQGGVSALTMDIFGDAAAQRKFEIRETNFKIESDLAEEAVFIFRTEQENKTKITPLSKAYQIRLRIEAIIKARHIVKAKALTIAYGAAKKSFTRRKPHLKVFCL